ncbi:MAG: YggT family protein [Gammaproteobacteria bacterium]|nr:YggT family protein [Gammaproteobacteria bacterium]
MAAIQYIVSALLWLLFFAFLLRVILQFVRADFRNPISQAVLKVTNPLVLPLRRVIPPLGKLDLASIVALLLVQVASVYLERALYGVGLPPAALMLQFAAVDLMRKVLQFYLVALIIYALLSWVAPGTYSPAASLLDRICEPLIIRCGA